MLTVPDRVARKYCPTCAEVYNDWQERERATSLVLTPPPLSFNAKRTPEMEAMSKIIDQNLAHLATPEDFYPATDHGHKDEVELRKCRYCNPPYGKNEPPKKHELFEARFDGELAYDESPLTVRVWVLHEGPLCNDELVQKQRKFNEMMEVGHLEGSGPELKDIARMISTMLGGATVELTTNNRKLGKLGIVYYPEWP